MTPLNLQQQARWNAAKSLFEGLVATAKRLDAVIMYDGEMITPDQIEISDGAIYVRSGATKVIWFEADPDFDHGLYTPIDEFEAEHRAAFALYKKITY
jgi:hypothetical protein